MSGNGDVLSATKTKGGLGNGVVEQHFLLIDELLNAHAADVRYLRDEPVVQALSCGFRGNGERLDGRVFGHAVAIV